MATSISVGGGLSLVIGSRPIADGEVTTAKLSSTAARDNLKAMNDNDREIVLTRPTTGKRKIIAMHLLESGLIEIEYETIAES